MFDEFVRNCIWTWRLDLWGSCGCPFVVDPCDVCDEYLLRSVSVCCGVELLCRSFPGFVVVPMGPLVVVSVLPFVILLRSLLLLSLCLLVACCELFWLSGS